jgi:hypothetical protein
MHITRSVKEHLFIEFEKLLFLDSVTSVRIHFPHELLHLSITQVGLPQTGLQQVSHLIFVKSSTAVLVVLLIEFINCNP